MWRWIPLAGLALLGACTDMPEACHMLHVSSLPFVVRNAHLYIPVGVNGQPALFFFDTGAFTTIVSKEAAARLNLEVSPEPFTIYGFGGETSARVAKAKTFVVGQMLGIGFPLIVADSFPHHYTPRPDGFLSTDFLRHYDIDIDFPHRQLRFFSPLGDCSHPSVYLDGDVYRISMLPPNGRTLSDYADIRIPVSIRGQSFIANFDSGSPRTTIFRETAEKLGIDAGRLQHDKQIELGGIGPKIETAPVHVSEPISVGEITIENLPTIVSANSRLSKGIDMILGLDFAARVHLWISYSSRSLVMQFPVRPSPRLPLPHLSAPVQPPVSSSQAPSGIPAPGFLSGGGRPVTR